MEYYGMNSTTNGGNHMLTREHELITVPEVALIFENRFSYKMILQLVHEKKLVAKKIGRNYYFSRNQCLERKKKWFNIPDMTPIV